MCANCASSRSCLSLCTIFSTCAWNSSALSVTKLTRIRSTLRMSASNAEVAISIRGAYSKQLDWCTPWLLSQIPKPAHRAQIMLHRALPKSWHLTKYKDPHRADMSLVQQLWSLTPFRWFPWLWYYLKQPMIYFSQLWIRISRRQ